MQATWQIAADQLRIPFWDWASNYTLPDIAEQATTQIMNSSGKYQTVNNPLYQYKFQNMPMNAQYFPTTDSDGWLAKYPQTMRGVSVQGGPSNPGLSNYYMAYYQFKSSTVSKSSRGMLSSADLRVVVCSYKICRTVQQLQHDSIFRNVIGVSSQQRPRSYRCKRWTHVTSSLRGL